MCDGDGDGVFLPPVVWEYMELLENLDLGNCLKMDTEGCDLLRL